MSEPNQKQCKNCGVFTNEHALFCDTCGYDFTTGALPQAADLAAVARPASAPAIDMDLTPSQAEQVDEVIDHYDQPTSSTPPPAIGPTRWVAEVWIDPEWYRQQQSPDQLPSPGLPQLVPLRGDLITIGRPTSGAPLPDINCSTDSGVSRNQARLISDGRRWWIEDAGSSNGTYIGKVDQPLPAEPISARTEIGSNDRIYLGSWTRIVVRAALVQESNL